MSPTREIHPVAELYPAMTDAEFTRLVESIRDSGFDPLRPIIVDKDGRIIDGRHRYRASHEAGVSPHFQTYDGDDPVAEALRLNTLARTLTETQRADLVVRSNALKAAERDARERMADAGRSASPGQPSEKGVSSRSHLSDAPKSRDIAGAAVGVSGTTVGRVKRIHEEAPDLAPKLATGELSAAAGERIVRERKGHAPPPPTPSPPMPGRMKRSPRTPNDESLRRCVEGIASITGTMSVLTWTTDDDSLRERMVKDLDRARLFIRTAIKSLQTGENE